MRAKRGNCYENSFLLLHLANQNVKRLLALAKKTPDEGVPLAEHHAEVARLVEMARKAKAAFRQAAQSPRRAMLVQGYPLHGAMHRPYGHSWVETEDGVIDVTYDIGDPMIWDVKKFYSEGRIDV